MLMHVNQARRIALLGVMAAISTVFLLLGTVIPVNTVFFTSAAAFLAGISLVLYGPGYGFAFYAACSALDFMLNPMPLHVFLYLVLAGYTLFAELTWRWLGKMAPGKKKDWLHRGIRFALFLILYVPLIWFAPGLFISVDRIDFAWYFPLLAAGIIGWVVFDFAYALCKRFIWKHFQSIWKEKERE